MTTTDTMRETLKVTEAQAAEKYAAFVALRDGMTAEGINLMEDRESFAKVEEAHKEYAALSDLAAEQRNVLALASGWDRPSQRPGLSMPNPGRDPNARPARLGQRFIQSDGYQGLRASGAFSGSEAMFASLAGQGFREPAQLMNRDEFSSLLETLRAGATTVTGGGSTSAGPFIQNDLQSGFVPYSRKRPLIAALVGQSQTDSDVVEYVTQSAVTNAAVETAEDTAAAEATYAFATNTTNVREITHYVPVTLRAMADEGQIRGIVENELAIDVLDRLDTQVVAGGGTGVDLTGITVWSGIGTLGLGADTRLDAVHKAITTIAVAAGVLDDADYIGMHPNDWQRVRLEKGTDGQYLMGPAGMEGAKQLWGVPVVTSTVFTEGTVLAGAFERSARLWLREGLAVTSGLDGNDFTKRRVSLLAAMRVAFAVTRPGGFCTVTGFN